MLNKFSSILFMIIMITFSIVIFDNAEVQAGQANEVNLYVDGEKLDFPDQGPYIDANNRTLIPVRFCAEKLKAKVEWNSKLQEVCIDQEETKVLPSVYIVIRIGEKDLVVNNRIKTMDTTAAIINGRTMVPVRFISEYLGASVKWYGPQQSVHIFTMGQSQEEIKEIIKASADKLAEQKKIMEINGENISQLDWDRQFLILKAGYEDRQGINLDEEKDGKVIDKLKELSLNNLVIQKLLLQEAEIKGVKVDEKELELSLQDFKNSKNKQYENAYDEFLQRINADEDIIQQEIRNGEIIKRLQATVTEIVELTDGEVQKYYEDNLNLFKKAGGIQISHILTDSEEKADELIAKINNGEDFAELAKQYSLCPSKDRGGDLGIINDETNFVEEFKKAALALAPGEMTSQAVKTSFGYHIIKAGPRIEESTIPFAEISEKLKMDLENEQKTRLFQSFINSLHNTAEIKDYR